MRCEKCGVEGARLDAHEVWEYIDAEDYGFEPTKLRQILDEWNGQQEAFWSNLYTRLRARDLCFRLTDRGSIAFKRCEEAIVQVLTEIQLLCRPCHHHQHHQHHSVANSTLNHSLVVHAEFNGFDELPDFKTYQAWEEHRQDATQLYVEAAAGWPFERRDYDADL